ncbi:MAG: helical backbone metal receptor [Winogradskyella sp.]
MTYKDQLNRRIQLDRVPKRIVSLVPSQTELLVDLGLKSSIVGVTKFCVHPRSLRKEVEVVGGTKHVKVQKIKDLQPDIILCNKEENSREIIESLKDLAPIHISDIYNLEDCYELIDMYGKLFSVENHATEIVQEIIRKKSDFQIKRKNGIKPKVAYFIWKNPWMVSASHTFIDSMILEAGFENVFKELKRYPEIDLNHPSLQKADAIFLSSEPYPFKEEHVIELKSKFPEKKIIIVDGELFSWYGSRLKHSFPYFETLLK